MEYFIYDGKEQSGPFTFDQLKQNRISKNILIWREGLDDWIEAEKLPELNNILNLKTPPIPNDRNRVNYNQNRFFTLIKSHILKNREFYALYLFLVFILFSLALFCENNEGFFPFSGFQKLSYRDSIVQEKFSEYFLRCYGFTEFITYSFFMLMVALFIIRINKTKIVQNNLTFFNVYSFWFFINLICLMLSYHTWGSLNYHKLFFPFSGYPEYFYSYEKNPFTLLRYSYDYSEFLIFTTSPIFVLLILILIPHEEIENENPLPHDEGEGNNTIIGEGKNIVYREVIGNIVLKIVSSNFNTIKAKVYINDFPAKDGVYVYKSLTHKLVIKDGEIIQRFFLEKVKDVIYEKQDANPHFDPKIGDKVYLLDWSPVPDGKYKFAFLKYYHIKNGVIVG
jgi:hypothetical protein